MATKAKINGGLEEVIHVTKQEMRKSKNDKQGETDSYSFSHGLPSVVQKVC